MRLHLLLSLLVLVACKAQTSSAKPITIATNSSGSIATFGGGCFWCMETAFEGMNGVHSVVSGYIDGHIKNPTYKQVSAGVSGHAEVVQVTFDPKIVSYSLLLNVFWANVDPFAKNAQFCDRGSQYRSGIFFHSQSQAIDAKQSQTDAEAQLKAKHPQIPVPEFQVQIKAADTFYPAEEYHQDYFKKNASHYKRYRKGCGRDRRLIQIWGESKNGKYIQRRATDEKNRDP